MKHTLPFDSGGRHLHKIHIGEFWASREPGIIRTVLGSCVAVCLRDPTTRVGGMNHFLLPMGASGDGVSARYGVHAMELLINDCMKQGAQRHALVAKVFGGGHVLKMRENDGNVPQSNIRFALHFLATEGIPLMARDLGGYAAREIYFFTDTGRILLKRLHETGAEMAALERTERACLRPIAYPAVSADASNVTLF